ncbi:MAG: HlyD family efflux transporter periplasmic adaptor subunit [Desulfamplus sp.]|nr:HlyD family efflux transporter periplasmic adaptor subunit [Desulfamplus sp.]
MKSIISIRNAIKPYLIIVSFLSIALSPFTVTSEAIALEQEWQVENATKEVEIRGYTRSIKSATISSEVNGRVVKVNYEIGDTIKAAPKLESNNNFAPFAEIDTTFVDFEIQSTKIAISKIKTQLKQIDSRIAYLRKEFRRKEELFTKGRATEVIRDAASQELEQAVLERETVKQSEETLDVSLNQLIERKKRHTIWGNAGWIVTAKKVEAGEMIQAGIPIGVIHDFRELVVPLSLSNEELDAIKGLGRTFKAALDNQTVKASIYYINPDFNEQTRKTEIKLLINHNSEKSKPKEKDNPIADNNQIEGGNGSDFEHRGGLSFILPLSVKTEGLKIPAKAVQNRYENPKIYVKGKTEPLSINILDKAGEYLIVAEQPDLLPNMILIEPPAKKE